MPVLTSKANLDEKITNRELALGREVRNLAVRREESSLFSSNGSPLHLVLVRKCHANEISREIQIGEKRFLWIKIFSFQLFLWGLFGCGEVGC